MRDQASALAATVGLFKLAQDSAAGALRERKAALAGKLALAIGKH